MCRNFNNLSRQTNSLKRCSLAACNRLTARDLLDPTFQRQSHPPSGSQEISHRLGSQESMRTSHQSPREASMRRRDAFTEASMYTV